MFFFFCTGLCYSNKYKTSDYIVRQAKKLLIPYFAVTVTYLCYRLYYGLWGDLPTKWIIQRFCSSLFTALPAEFDDIALVGGGNIGIGPIWFFPCLFLSSVIYKLLYNVKGKFIICVLLAAVSSASQDYVVIPFTIQDAFIGCMFIALGDLTKDFVFKMVDALKRIHILLLVLCCAVSFVLYYFIWKYATNQFLDLGSNVYSLRSLETTLPGFVMVIIASVFVERTGILDEFLAFYGKESLIIVTVHTFDILMIRNWSMRDNSFLVGTLLLYAFAAYLYCRGKRVAKEKLTSLKAQCRHGG